MKPPVLLRPNHGQNKNQNESEYALVAKAKENLRAETVAVMTRTATRARICFTNFSKMGVELFKVTGHGVGGDCERVLFYEINGGGEGECSTVTEVRGWAQEHGARNTERTN
jgi:hypothetical protein